MSPLLTQWSDVKKPVIGMLHLLPLPLSPGYDGNLETIRATLLRDVDALAAGGVHGLMMENFGDEYIQYVKQTGRVFPRLFNK